MQPGEAIVDLYKFQADMAARRRMDEELVRDLCDNLLLYAKQLAAAEKRIVELEGQLKARETDAGTGVHERTSASPIGPGGGADGDQGAMGGGKTEGAP